MNFTGIRTKKQRAQSLTNNARATQTHDEYRECVNEIRNEGVVLGSLAIHKKAMKRLDERQRLSLKAEEQPNDNSEDLMRNNHRQNRLLQSLTQSAFTQSVARAGEGLASSLFNGGAKEPDPSANVVLGRRKSQVGDGNNIEFDMAVNSDLFEDLELSDESEDEQPALGQLLEENSKNNRRGSFLRIMSSLTTGNRDAMSGDSRRSSLLKRASSRLTRRKSHQSSSSRSIPSSLNDASENQGSRETSGTSSREDGAQHSNDNNNVQTPSSIRGRSHNKRRSSLLSVDEMSDSSDFGDMAADDHTSTKSATDGHLVRGFNAKSSFASSIGSYDRDDGLLVGWGRRSSILSIPEEDLHAKEENEKKGNCKDKEGFNTSLICGWNNSEQSMSSVSEPNHLAHKQGGDSLALQEAENILLQAKKSTSLFDVHNGQVA